MTKTAVKLLRRLWSTLLEVGCDSRPATILKGVRDLKAAGELEALGFIEVKNLPDKVVAYLNHTARHIHDDWEGAWDRLLHERYPGKVR